jgi:hypothetical protein
MECRRSSGADAFGFAALSDRSHPATNGRRFDPTICLRGEETGDRFWQGWQGGKTVTGTPCLEDRKKNAPVCPPGAGRLLRTGKAASSLHGLLEPNGDPPFGDGDGAARLGLPPSHFTKDAPANFSESARGNLLTRQTGHASLAASLVSYYVLRKSRTIELRKDGVT